MQMNKAFYEQESPPLARAIVKAFPELRALILNFRCFDVPSLLENLANARIQLRKLVRECAWLFCAVRQKHAVLQETYICVCVGSASEDRHS